MTANIFGSEQKRPGANRPPEVVPESPLRGLWESYFLQGIIGKTHTQNLQILWEDTLGPLARPAPFVYFRNIFGGMVNPFPVLRRCRGWGSQRPCRVVTGKSLDSPEKGNVDKMSEKCRKNVRKMSKNCPEALQTQFCGHFLDIFCLFGRCFCLVTLSNARPLRRCRGWGSQPPTYIDVPQAQH